MNLVFYVLPTADWSDRFVSVKRTSSPDSSSMGPTRPRAGIDANLRSPLSRHFCDLIDVSLAQFPPSDWTSWAHDGAGSGGRPSSSRNVLSKGCVPGVGERELDRLVRHFEERNSFESGRT
jgi:hypothetical protein